MKSSRVEINKLWTMYVLSKMAIDLGGMDISVAGDEALGKLCFSEHFSEDYTVSNIMENVIKESELGVKIVKFFIESQRLLRERGYGLAVVF